MHTMLNAHEWLAAEVPEALQDVASALQQVPVDKLRADLTRTVVLQGDWGGLALNGPLQEGTELPVLGLLNALFGTERFRIVVGLADNGEGPIEFVAIADVQTSGVVPTGHEPIHPG